MNSLIEHWRSMAAELEGYAATGQAVTLRKCADELEDCVRQEACESLTIREAATESGYSYSAIQKKLASGELDNVGKPNAPRVRRDQLPRKARLRLVR